jgi:Terminase small subunit
MSQLRNTRHEQFAQFVAHGSPQSEAYRRVVGNGASAKNANVHADEWMNRPGVRERVAELKEANSRKATLSREQTIEFLCNVISTSAAKVEADSPLVQSAEFVDGKPVKLRIPDKIAAAKELTKMCGWAKPDRIELAATDTLGDFINSIRQAGGRDSLPWRSAGGYCTRKKTGSEAQLWAHTSHFRRIDRSQAGSIWSPLREP